MKIRDCVGFLVAGVVAGVALAQRDGSRSGGPRGEVIYDTLRFADEQIYDGGNGDAWSGRGAFGGLYDEQVCDDFVTTAKSTIVQVTADYVTFFGGTPSVGLQVEVFEDRGGRPADDALYSIIRPVTESTSWSDPHFGLLGRRLTAEVSIPLTPDTSYYLMIQAIDPTAQGDWYYIICDTDSRIGGDRHLRTGGRAYNWATDWASAGDIGYGIGDVGMQIRAVPTPGSGLVVMAAGAWSARRRRV